MLGNAEQCLVMLNMFSEAGKCLQTLTKKNTFINQSLMLPYTYNSQKWTYGKIMAIRKGSLPHWTTANIYILIASNQL